MLQPAGQPLIISCLAIAGATGPVTLAGNLALQNAEVLAGIVLAQLVREGTPVSPRGCFFHHRDAQRHPEYRFTRNGH